MSQVCGSDAPSPIGRRSARACRSAISSCPVGRVRSPRRRSAGGTGAAVEPLGRVSRLAARPQRRRAERSGSVDAAIPGWTGRRRLFSRTTSIRRKGWRISSARFVPLEDARRARVPRATSCRAPGRSITRVLAEIAARGHRVGVHGYDHSNTTPFADAGERARRLDAARPFAERYGATGYRCALAAADARAAEGSGYTLSVRQQHSDVGRTVSGAEQRLRHRPPVRRRGDRRIAADHAARRQPAVSRLLPGRDRRVVDRMRRHHCPRQAASSSC